ncbi:hypothetical protein [Bifidobacterium aquikefiri]|uniref:hypothetical protein n=1 Tax=Bifidobacterium aquikefiri TaxID=1653207 RepID=UPI0023F105E1|nr:hypothetical protein [Bifidobacterium aquikefiri]
MPTNSSFQPVILHASDDGSDVERGLRLSKSIKANPQCSDSVFLVINHTAITAAPSIHREDIPAGVEVYACATALSTHKIAQESLDPAIHVVPSGIVFIAEQQRHQAFYIRL